MLALEQHENSLCPGCGHPKEAAWHPEETGWFDKVLEFTCDACKHTHGESAAVYKIAVDTWDESKKGPRPPWPDLLPETAPGPTPMPT